MDDGENLVFDGIDEESSLQDSSEGYSPDEFLPENDVRDGVNQFIGQSTAKLPECSIKKNYSDVAREMNACLRLASNDSKMMLSLYNIFQSTRIRMQNKDTLDFMFSMS